MSCGRFSWALAKPGEKTSTRASHPTRTVRSDMAVVLRVGGPSLRAFLGVSPRRSVDAVREGPFTGPSRCVQPRSGSRPDAPGRTAGLKQPFEGVAGGPHAVLLPDLFADRPRPPRVGRILKTSPQHGGDAS